MAHLWVQDDANAWGWFPLAAEVLSLPDALPTAGPRTQDGQAGHEAILMRSPGAGATRWVLLAASQGVLVNGLPLHTGIRVLSDRDEICLGAAGAVYFSTETLATVEVFPGSEQPVYCPRCKQEIAPGSNAVKCPQCGVWHHQSEELPCWTYSPRCALCDQPTELGGSYRWSPEEL
jgi:predicted RNA-binding Zn-ribbon protein involved in translation (DUF1610 family)